MNNVKVVGKGGISATIIAHSKSAVDGSEILTYELEYHRYIHGEFMTHRLFSRNAASSRAIPVAKMIELVKNSPAVPIHWGKNQAGMQAKEECDAKVFAYPMDTNCLADCDCVSREEAWKNASHNAVVAASYFNDAGYHKQIVNRLLEPFQMIKVVVTATEWDNFFWLRFHDKAQPEIYELARCMLAAKKRSVPELLNVGEWHVPYVKTLKFKNSPRVYCKWVKERVLDDGQTETTFEEMSLEEALHVSASCSAQVSYRKTDNSLEKGERVWQMLTTDDRLHCFDDKTEVLTNTGFKLFKDVKQSDLVADVCSKTGKLNGFATPLMYIRKSYTGEMAYLEAKDVDFRVTIDHTMLGCVRSNKEDRKTFNIRSFKFSDKTSNKSKKETMLNVECSFLTNPFVEKNEIPFGNLVGMYIGDGYKKDRRMMFRFKKQRKVDYLTKVLSEIGLDYFTRIYNGVTLFTVKSCDIVDKIFTICGDKCENKRIGEWPLSLYPSIYDGLCNSDGSVKRKTWRYFTTSERLKADFLSFAPLAGITVFEHKAKGSCYRFGVKTTNNVIINDSRKPQSYVQKESVVNEDVFCLTMPSGGLVVRRNGKTLVCGNCSPMEHQATPIHWISADTDCGLAFGNEYDQDLPDGITHMDRDGNFWSNNFKGWIQHRALIPNNNCTSFDYTQEIDETGLEIEDNKSGY